LLFIDLDGFKQVNDRLGHRAGDEVLKLVALRANACCREYDILGRLGGDEFVLIANLGVDSAHTAGRIATAVISSINQPMGDIEQGLRVSASIGIAMYPEDGTSVDTLLGVADKQMYRAKRNRLGWASVREINTQPVKCVP
jgi:diguanylate cyclase (GGDEF) domain